MKFEFKSRLVRIVIEFFPGAIPLRRYAVAPPRQTQAVKREILRRALEQLKGELGTGGTS